MVGSVGCRFLRRTIPAFKKLHGVDLTICNGENSADGNGITPRSADFLFSSGVDIITLGNHSFRRREIFAYLNESDYIIRPLNFPEATTPGRGLCTVDLGYTRVCVLNLMGQQYIDAGLDNPFLCIDRALKSVDAPVVLVDFHAEATSEKRAMGYYLDGRVSAVFGTHTHVQTADEEVLPHGTGYITDLGMTGPIHSVIGVDKDIIIRRFTSKLPERFDYADGDCKLDCVIFDIDHRSGRCTDAVRYELR